MLQPTDPVAAFASTLPAEYRDRYSEKAIAAHAALCARRVGSSVEIGIFEQREELIGVCIVTSDRPGLLSLISEAFVVCGLDVVNGDAFTRDSGQALEAVDLFWVRPAADAPLDDAGVEKLRAVLASLRDGYRTPAPPTVSFGPTTRSNSTVRFIEDHNGALSTLEVETEDRTGLLLSLSRALHAQHVQILRSEVKTQRGRVFDRFVIAELDGAPVSAMRRLEIQVAVLSAAEPAKRLTSSPPPP